MDRFANLAATRLAESIGASDDKLGVLSRLGFAVEFAYRVVGRRRDVEARRLPAVQLPKARRR